MDDVEPQEVAPNSPAIRFGTQLDIVEDPNTGLALYSHTIVFGITSYTYGLPLAENEPYFENLAAHARSLVKEYRRKKSGIHLPSDGTTTRHHSGLHVPRNGRRR